MTAVPASAWPQIRAGRRPDPQTLAQVAGEHLATQGSGGVAAARHELETELLGAGPLEPLLAEPGISDVAVNGDGSVWVDRGTGMRRAEVRVDGPAAVRRLAIRLAGLAGRRLDETCPFVDGVLPSGVRLHAALPPLVGGGPHITLRVPARKALTLDDVEASGAVPPGGADLLRGVVQARVAFLVTGGTGAGKTTLLGAMLAAASPDERIVLVEDVRELRVDHPQVVSLEARPPNVEGAGEITLTTLVRQALRMRPDRLVLGEARGAEIREMLAALNTGHEGGCGTVHANSAADVVPRVEALGALAGMNRDAVHAQLVSAVQLVAHLRRRVVQSISVLGRDAGAEVGVVTALSAGDDGQGWVRGPAAARLAALLDGEGPDARSDLDVWLGTQDGLRTQASPGAQAGPGADHRWGVRVGQPSGGRAWPSLQQEVL